MNMKLRTGTLPVWLLCLITLFVSCQDQDYLSPSRSAVVTFTSNLSGSVTRSSSLSFDLRRPLVGEGRGEAVGSGSSVTRASNDQWSPSDQVGIYMLSASSTDLLSLTDGNHLYTTNNTEAAATANLVASVGDELKFPSDKREVRFIAYYPYLSTLGDYGDVYPVRVSDGLSAQVFEDIDLLYHKDADDVSYTYDSGAVPLAFRHQMSKVIINVSRSADVISDLNADPGLSFTGMPTAANFHLDARAWSGFYGTDVKIIPVFDGDSNTADFARWEAIVIPHTVTNSDTGNGRVLAFSFDGMDHRFTLPTNQVYEPGKVYTHNFRLTPKEVVLEGSTITDWVATSISEKLTVEKTNIVLPHTSGASEDIKLSAKGDVTVTCATSTSATTISSTKPTWLSATLNVPNSGDGNWKDYSPFTIGTTSANTTSAPRVGYVHVLVDGVSVSVITVTQQTSTITDQAPTAAPDGASNCYIVSAGGSVTFTARRAFTCSGTLDYSSELRVDGSNYTDALGVSVLWTDNPGLVKSVAVNGIGSDAMISVFINEQQYGNAVVKLYKASDATKTSVWTYHIWVPEDAVSPLTGWLQHNLGATKQAAATATQEMMGLYYQWGRKDPFPAAGGINGGVDATYVPGSTIYTMNASGNGFDTQLEYAPPVDASINTAAKSIIAPMTFVPASGSWEGCDGADSWKKSGVKTIYDPCPAGYEVPDDTKWTTPNWINEGDNVWRHDSYGGYYPPAGGLASDNGMPWYMNNSYMWSATHTGATTANALRLRGGNDLVVLGYNKSQGGPVRCTAEAAYLNEPSRTSISRNVIGGAESFTIDTNMSFELTTDNNVMITNLGSSGTGTTKTISFTITPNSATVTATRTASIYIKAGGATKTVTVTQAGLYIKTQTSTGVSDGMSNCYIVTPGGEIAFPVTRAYSSGTTLRVDGTTYTGAFTLDLVWEEGAVFRADWSGVIGSGNAGVVVVKTNNVHGSAVVALKDASGAIVWSYHIWVTDYDPSANGSSWENTFNTNNNGYHFVFMDRNLGATAAGMSADASNSNGINGMLYQFGRKDPFLTTGTVSHLALSATDNTIQYTIKNPHRFLNATGDDFKQDNTQWGHGKTTAKSIYDPCPSGWRVPSHNVAANDYASEATSPWYGLDLTNIVGTYDAGYSWGNNARFPAAGRRYAASQLGEVGWYGLYWSASPYDADGNGSPFWFSDTDSGAAGSDPYCCAFSIRCVKE